MSDPRRQRRLWYVIGGVLIAGFVAFGATSFKKNITPYVGFEEARRLASRVQVAGELVPDSTRYVEDSQQLEFVMADHHGHTMRVLYHGTKPGNFEEATQIVAVGTYDGDAFQAEQLLVKCPSKYQGLEEAS
jgi:cytochrome c-type biogenesis protein CcmE